jgi:hypothetical protein
VRQSVPRLVKSWKKVKAFWAYITHWWVGIMFIAFLPKDSIFFESIHTRTAVGQTFPITI